MITTGKIPDSHIIFLDEIWKSNDGVLNSLLTALNERRYTNESETVDIPAISFMSASNEIPNFNDTTEKILKPLYDRFEIKVVTKYIEEKSARLKMLIQKQNTLKNKITSTITLDELYLMQEEVSNVEVPMQINELMDDVLCELRRLGIHVSDRKFLNYYPIAQAKAWLNGRNIAKSSDLTVLKNYLWTTVEELPAIEKVLERFCINPLQEKLKEIDFLAQESYTEFGNITGNLTKPLIKLRGEFLRLFSMLNNLKDNESEQSSVQSIDEEIARLEGYSKTAHEKANFTYAPLVELEKLA